MSPDLDLDLNDSKQITRMIRRFLTMQHHTTFRYKMSGSWEDIVQTNTDNLCLTFVVTLTLNTEIQSHRRSMTIMYNLT